MKILVAKVGGGAGVNLDAVCADVAALVASGQPVVLVHGTSAAADALAQKAGVPVRQLTSPSGHVSRYTDPEMLEIYVAAAAGQVNKRLVATLQGLGCNAVGLIRRRWPAVGGRAQGCSTLGRGWPPTHRAR